MREFPSPQEILKVFEREPGKTFRLRELVVELGLRSSQARDLKNALKDLARHQTHRLSEEEPLRVGGKGELRTTPPFGTPPGQEGIEFPSSIAGAPKGGAVGHEIVKGPWPEPSHRTRGANVASGRLIGHRDGYGFVVPDAPVAGTDQDIYISSDGMGSAMNGDRVEVQVLRAKPDGRLEGRILRVTDRAQKTVVGQFHCGQRYNSVLPFDHRIPFEIVIPRGEEWPGGESPAPPTAGAIASLGASRKAKRRGRR